MTTMEMLPYSPDQRDAVERRLASEAKKPEIHAERRHGLVIAVYYLRELGQVSMSLIEGGNMREFIIPNDEVNEAIAHPEVYANRSGLPRFDK